MNKKLVLLIALNALMPCTITKPAATLSGNQVNLTPGRAAGMSTASEARGLEVERKEMADLPSNLREVQELDAVIAQMTANNQPLAASEKSESVAILEGPMAQGTPSRFARFKTWVLSCFTQAMPEYSDIQKYPLNRGEETIVTLFRNSGTHEKRYLRYLLEAANHKRTWEITQLEGLILKPNAALNTLKTLATAYGYYYTATLACKAKAAAQSVASTIATLSLRQQEVVTEAEIIILMRKTEDIKKIISTIISKPTLDTYINILNTFTSREAHLTWHDMPLEAKVNLISALKSKQCGPYMACFSSHEVDNLDPELRMRHVPITFIQSIENMLHDVTAYEKQLAVTLLVTAVTRGLLTYKDMPGTQIRKAIGSKIASIFALLADKNIISSSKASQLAAAVNRVTLTLPVTKLATAASSAAAWKLYDAGDKIRNLRWKRMGKSYPLIGKLPRIVDASKQEIGYSAE